MKVKPAMSTLVKASLIAAAFAAMPAGADATQDLRDTSWASDPAHDCFVMGFDLHPDARVYMVTTSMDELVGKWKLTGKTFDTTVYRDENSPPLVLKGEVSGDVMQATYTWNEGTDAGPETETCEFVRGKN